LTIVVVGRFPGTGVPAEWNLLIDHMKSVAAKTATSAPNGFAELGTNGIGHTKCNKTPVVIAIM
jgi:hypothetical protein